MPGGTESVGILFALCLQDQIVTRSVWRAEFQSWVTADVAGANGAGATYAAVHI